MGRFHSLLVAILLAAACVAHGEDKILFDGKGKSWKTTIKADPENPDRKAMFWGREQDMKSEALDVKDRDWSAYSALCFKMYSPEVDSRSVTITCSSNPDGKAPADEGNYYLKKIKLDWKGWRTITIPFADFKAIRNPVGWKYIHAISFQDKGFGEERNPNADYYIVDVTLIGVAASSEPK